MTKYRRVHPDRYQASTKINNAVRDGKIKPKACEVCGKTPALAHHPNYSRPMDVQWLCRTHHGKAHTA